ncbi:signal peptide peptidase SppA [Pradoshia sp. D12]|uniref:signal peptide peptidase SppA n=1 Tax=Bacillaceae TaxID=186817 RepID=UPI00112D58B1|nr:MULTISPECIES: signal peptide peptidase SppA [Bacillaceae]QFK72518.1 signal peptide peptidase SppA [Pradoshia sp. D12]TPF70738.1 signal peptide peptidase SppA [Bacillus sp. D12]
MSKKRWLALGIAAVIFFVSVLMNAISTFSSEESAMTNLFEDTLFEEDIIEEGDVNSQIVVMDVEGVIQDTGEEESYFTAEAYNHRSFMERLNAIKDNDTVKGIILRVNSPGGGVVESAEIHNKLMQIKKETKKPIYVSMGSQAASGGYYISTPADKIFASPETMTGSLGVIMQSYNFKGLAEKYGIDMVTIKSGKFKDLMNPFREVTEDEKEILQSMVTSSYDQFVKVIAEGRSMPEDEVRKIADGRIYDGRQAKEINLIDELGYLEDVIADMKKSENLKGAQVVRLVGSDSLSSLFSMKMQQWAGVNDEVSTIKSLMTENQSPRMMYLYSAN